MKDTDIQTTEVVTHAVWQGLPLCKFTNKAPENWPDGHDWTYVRNVGEITCPTCLEEAKKRNSCS